MNIDLPRLGGEAIELAYEQGLNHRDPGECAWALLVDAMRTIAVASAGGPGGGPPASYGSCMPTPMPDHWEAFGTIREALSEGLTRAPIARPPRIMPTARAVSRYDEVMELWHPRTFSGAIRRPADVTRAMMLLAGGSSMRRVSKIVAIPKGSLTHYRNLTSRTVGRIVLPYLEQVAKAS